MKWRGAGGEKRRGEEYLISSAQASLITEQYRTEFHARVSRGSCHRLVRHKHGHSLPSEHPDTVTPRPREN